MLLISICAVFGQVEWTLYNTVPHGNSFYSVIYDDNQYIAAGASTIATSPDGINWTQKSRGLGYILYSISSGNSCCVAVGSHNDTIGIMIYSHGGTIWYAGTPGKIPPLYSITYGNNIFVAVGMSGTVFSSPDGMSWTSRNSGTTNNLNAVIYSNGQFLAVGSTSSIVTSTDGIHWTYKALDTAIGLLSVTYNDGQYMAVGKNGAVLYSADGVSWEYRTSGISQRLRSVVYGNGQYVAVGDYGAILSSADGISWTSRTSGVFHDLRSVLYVPNQYITVGVSGTLLISPAVNSAVDNKRGKQLSGNTLYANYLELQNLQIVIPEKFRASDVTAAIYSITGKKLCTSPISAVSGQARMHTPILPVGVYVVGVKATGYREYAKFVVMR